MGFEEIHAPQEWSNDGYELHRPLLAIVVRAEFRPPSGATFFTQADQPQQFACMAYDQGHVVPAHTHNGHHRHVYNTQEVLFVRKGLVELDLYTEAGKEVAKRYLSAGDAVALLCGGHRLTFRAPTELFEVKTGPYFGRNQDKRELEIK